MYNLAPAPEESEDTTMSWLLHKIFFILSAVFIIGFGVQTWFLVTHLLPQDHVLMQVLTVFSFDGMAALYFLAWFFYRDKQGRSKFRSHQSLNAVKIGFYFSLSASLACTIVWMILDNVGFDWSKVPYPIIIGVYILITFAIAYHVINGYCIGAQEHMAKYEPGQGNKNSLTNTERFLHAPAIIPDEHGNDRLVTNKEWIAWLQQQQGNKNSPSLPELQARAENWARQNGFPASLVKKAVTEIMGPSQDTGELSADPLASRVQPKKIK